MEKGELTQNLKRGDTWVRGLYMLLFAVIYSVAEVVLVVLAVFQFISRLITNRVNERLLKLGQQLSTYLYQLLLFFTFNSEERPYPFAAWPRGVPAAPKTRKTPAARKKTAGTKPADADSESKETAES